MNACYFFVKYLIRFALWSYFRKIKIEGVKNIPMDAPLLVTPNHQNALIDALIVGAFFPKSIYFLARQDVFSTWNRSILKALKMMPVYRIRDGYSQLKKNEGIFHVCFDLFSKNRSVLIFPEGNHGEHHYLRPLTKGAARIALQSEAKADKSLMILPVGINYFDHKAARSTVVLVYGKPIAISEYKETYQENKAKGLKQLRDVMTERMRQTLVIPDHSKDYEEDSAFIFQEKHSGLNFKELRALSDSENGTIEYGRKKSKLFASILNPVPFYVIRYVLRGLNDVVFTSTIKFAVGLITFPLWWIFVFVVSDFFFSVEISILLIFTMVFGLFYSYQKWS